MGIDEVNSRVQTNGAPVVNMGELKDTIHVQDTVFFHLPLLNPQALCTSFFIKGAYYLPPFLKGDKGGFLFI